MDRKLNREDYIYWMSIICVLCLLIIYGGIFGVSYLTGIREIATCQFKEITGIPCPGCGGCHALVALFHGNILEALHYHAFVVYGACIYLVYFISHTVELISGRRFHGLKYRDSYLFIGLIILVIQYTIKLCGIFFGK